MSSVSRSSRISAKSQVIIDAQDKQLAEQGGQISGMAREMAVMKRLLEQAGIKPPTENMDQDQVPNSEVSRQTKKRHLSGSTSGKLWGESDSSATSDDVSDEDRQLSFLKKKTSNVDKTNKDKKSKLSKKARRRARILHASLDKQKMVQRNEEDAIENGTESEKSKNTTAVLLPVGAGAAAMDGVADVNEIVMVEDTENGSGKEVYVPPTLPALPDLPALPTPPTLSTQQGLYSQILSDKRQTRPQMPSNAVPTAAAAAAAAIPPVFRTPGPDGPLRDEITIEVNKMDGKARARAV